MVTAQEARRRGGYIMLLEGNSLFFDSKNKGKIDVSLLQFILSSSLNCLFLLVFFPEKLAFHREIFVIC